MTDTAVGTGTDRATGSAVGAKLDDDVLARRTRLPLKPDPVTLVGTRVRLQPLDLDRDVAALHAVSNGQPAALGQRRVEA